MVPSSGDLVGEMSHVIGVDVGGTFTDALLMPLDGSRTVLAKVPTAADPADSVVAAVIEAVERAEVDASSVALILNGTTIATNTVLEGNGARVGALVTRGFRYVLEIARSWTPGPISGWMVWNKPAALADVRDIVEIRGRITARGELLEPIDEREVRAAVESLAARGVEALTISLFNGYARPDIEVQIRELARDVAPDLPVSLASEVLPEFREYERTLAGVANAYVQPAMQSYVKALQASLQPAAPRATVNIVRSDGGVMSTEEAARRPVETVFSGAAGGVRAAVHLGELVGVRRVLSFDMGGTSTDVALSRDGHAAISRTSSLTDYFRVRVPSLDVISIGAGGGSIAHVPMTGALRVGPQSAGAFPGPACYGRGGTEPTVTDANAALGYLTNLLGGQMDFHRDRALQAVASLAKRLGMTVEQAARAIVTIANEKMLSGLRLVSVQRGHDPREFALVAFGGAGPLHANALMELLGSPFCVIPPTPGVFSTFGFLVADVRREFARTHIRRRSELDDADLVDLISQLEEEARSWLESDGFSSQDQLITWQFGMRYFRQGYELPVTHDDPMSDGALLDTLCDRFVVAHDQTYGFDLDLEPELVVLRCIATGLTTSPLVQPAPPASGGIEDALVDPQHLIWWAGEWVCGLRYARALLGPGQKLAGPCVIEQEDSTTLVHPGSAVSVDQYLNLILRPA